MKPFITFLAIAYFISLSFQSPATEGTLREPETSASLSGRVTDSASGSGIAYASVLLFTSDSTLAYGTITAENGNFRLEDLKPGKYYLEIRYAGYRQLVVQDIRIEKDKGTGQLGEIHIQPEARILSQVQVSGQISGLTYHPDKQVINASQVPDGGVGTAASLLQNSPSVTVNNDNQVLLRGSSSFMLLIDGRIVMLSASEVLQQIPASQVDRIEIITSPSAKHDAEGGAGIIQVILKKDLAGNTSGMVNLKAGMYDKYNLDGGFRIKRKRFSMDLNAGWYNHKGFPHSTTERSYRNGNLERVVSGDGKIFRIRDGAFIGTSFGWEPSTTIRVNLWGDLSWFGFTRYTGTLYEDYTSGSDTSLYSLSNDKFILNGLTGNYGLSCRKILDTNDHYLEASIYRTSWLGYNNNYIHRYRSNSQRLELEKTLGRSYEEDNLQGDLQSKIDYVKQWPEIRLETGVMVTLRTTDCDFETLLLNPVTNIWHPDTTGNGLHDFDQTKYAGYGLVSGKISGLSVQGGLRAEHYIRDFTLPESAYTNHFEHTYWFPSLHLSFELPWKSQVQAGFNRRISYPNDWSLTPNPFFSDGYTYQIGNPELQPELISNAEVTLQQYFGKHVVNSTFYYRYHQGQIVRTVDLSKAPLMWMGYANLHHSTFSGLEINGNVRIFKKISVNSSVNLYRQTTVVQVDTPSTPAYVNTFQIRAMLNYTPWKNTRLQAALQYFGPEQEGTSKRLAMYNVSLTARQDLFGKKLSASLQVYDLFHTMVYRYSFKSGDGASIVTWCPEYPLVTLSLTWLFNDYKPQPQPPSGQDNNSGLPL
ncbi:MAG TPA: TonB-dependent receptor [Bacteroidales bacterium]|nr:TonB-dependent receptor [Bacteroidales bacterium]HRZ49763.1 TonB-dependent receptor [Bacteroidales bacterium]